METSQLICSEKLVDWFLDDRNIAFNSFLANVPIL